MQKVGYSLNFEEDKWQSILNVYNSPSNNIRFSSGNLTLDELKAHCSSNFSEDENDPKYDIVRRWCVEPRTVGYHLTMSRATHVNSQCNPQLEIQPWHDDYEKAIISCKRKES